MTAIETLAAMEAAGQIHSVTWRCDAHLDGGSVCEWSTGAEDAAQAIVNVLAERGVVPEDPVRVLADAFAAGVLIALLMDGEGWSARTAAPHDWLHYDTSSELVARLRERGVLPPAGGAA